MDRFALPAPFEVDQSLKSNSAIAPYYISVADALCSRPSSRVKCKVTNDGVPLLFDRDHFTDIGSVEVVTRLKSQLERKLQMARASF